MLVRMGPGFIWFVLFVEMMPGQQYHRHRHWRHHHHHHHHYLSGGSRLNIHWPIALSAWSVSGFS